MTQCSARHATSDVRPAHCLAISLLLFCLLQEGTRCLSAENLMSHCAPLRSSGTPDVLSACCLAVSPGLLTMLHARHLHWGCAHCWQQWCCSSAQCTAALLHRKTFQCTLYGSKVIETLSEFASCRTPMLDNVQTLGCYIAAVLCYCYQSVLCWHGLCRRCSTLHYSLGQLDYLALLATLACDMHDHCGEDTHCSSMHEGITQSIKPCPVRAVDGH